MQDFRLADEFEPISPLPAPSRWRSLRALSSVSSLRMGSFSGGLGAKAGAMMAVAMFALGFVAMKGHFGPRADEHAKTELASVAPVPTAPPAAAPVVALQAQAPADPSPSAQKTDVNAASRVDPSSTGSIGPDPKKKHKHKHKLELAKPEKPN